MGGSQYQAKLLIDRLCELGTHEVYYLTRSIDPEFSPRGYQILRIGTVKGVGRYGHFVDTFRLLKSLREIDPDVIYQMVGCAYTGIAAFYSKRSGCRLVWRVTSDKSVVKGKTTFGNLLPHRFLEQKLLEYGIRRADDIVIQTRQQSDLLQKSYNRVPTALIRNCHPFPKSIDMKKGRIKVVWIANLKKLKQPELFVRLASDLSEFEDVQFVMVGGQADSKKWCSRIVKEIDKQKNLSYVGVKSQKYVNSLMDESHILVNTSLYEGFSNTFIQAWMRKMAVVSLCVNPDGVFEENFLGIHCEDDYEKLRESVATLIREPGQIEKIGQRAEKYALETHSLDNLESLIELLTPKTSG